MDFVIGLVSGILLTGLAEVLRIRAEASKRKRDEEAQERVRLSKIVAPLKQAINRADELWIGMTNPEANWQPRSIPLDEDLRALAQAWDEPSVGPLVSDAAVRDAYHAAGISRWANHWEWLRKGEGKQDIQSLSEAVGLEDDPSLPPNLDPIEKACWYSARHIANDLGSFRNEVERYVPLY